LYILLYTKFFTR